MVFPMVGPGMSYDKMLTGEFIKSRGSDDDDGDFKPSSMF
jgi:hypothetical protein